MTKKAQINCAWCGKTIPVSEVKVRRYKNDYGAVVERKCPNCGGVLAAYLDEEGDFLLKIRTF